MQLTNQLSCTLSQIKQDVPHQAWESLAAIQPEEFPVWLSRVFINKYHIFGRNLAQCYLHYLSPNFWMAWLGIFLGFTLWFGLLILAFSLPKRFRIWLIIAILIWPFWWMI